MPKAFIIRPFGEKEDSAGTKINFDRIDRLLFRRALKMAGFRGTTQTGDLFAAGNIREDMFKLILEADLVLADITIHNANVFYELGIRHALRKRHTIMVKGIAEKGKPVKDATPFDILTDRYFSYELIKPERALDGLVRTIAATMETECPTDSPVYKLLPGLEEANPADVIMVPLTFQEEIEQAWAAQDTRALISLSGKLAGEDFEWAALRIIAAAQVKLADYTAACKNWERLRSSFPGDIEANLALANLYEKQYRSSNKPALLEQSNQAIARVLATRRLTSGQQAEANALKGRNAKTQWRLGFATIQNTGDKRRAALNGKLKDAYEAYRNAFQLDLNHYWSAITTYQMCALLLELSTLDEWETLFSKSQAAKSYRKELQNQMQVYRAIVPLVVESAGRRIPKNDPDYVWVQVTKADVLFLTAPDKRDSLIKAYMDAIPDNAPHVWISARDQLQLFADLGFQTEPALAIIKAIAPRFKALAN